jgi:hypothetical protein
MKLPSAKKPIEATKLLVFSIVTAIVAVACSGTVSANPIKTGTFSYSYSDLVHDKDTCAYCSDSFGQASTLTIAPSQRETLRLSALGIADEDLVQNGANVVAKGAIVVPALLILPPQPCVKAFRQIISLSEIGKVLAGTGGQEDGKICGKGSFEHQCSCVYVLRGMKISDK